MVVRAHVRGDESRPAGLVEVLPFAERTGERVERATVVTGGETRHRGGVQATAEVRPERNVRTELEANRVLDEGGELLAEIAFRVMLVGGEVELPVFRGGGRCSRAHGQAVPGKQLVHAAKQGLVAQAELEREVIGETGRLDRSLRTGEGEERLDLRGEREHVGREEVVQGLDAETVACEEQVALLSVPDREREHSVQPLEAGRPFALKQLENHFRVGARAEAVAELLQCLS